MVASFRTTKNRRNTISDGADSGIMVATTTNNKTKPNDPTAVSKRRGRVIGTVQKKRVTRQRSSSLSDIYKFRNSTRNSVLGREADAEQLPIAGAFTSLRSKYLAAMKGSNEKGVFSRADLTEVGQIEEGTIETAIKPRRRTVLRTRSRSLTMIDSGRLSRRGARNPNTNDRSVGVKKVLVPKRHSIVVMQQHQQQPTSQVLKARININNNDKESDQLKKQEPKNLVPIRHSTEVMQAQQEQKPQQSNRGRARGRAVARSRSRSLTAPSIDTKIDEDAKKADVPEPTIAKRSYRLKPEHRKSKPRRMRSRSLTAIKDETASARNLISMFERKNSTEVTVAKRNVPIGMLKLVQTRRKPQRMRSRSMTAPIKREAMKKKMVKRASMSSINTGTSSSANTSIECIKLRKVTTNEVKPNFVISDHKPMRTGRKVNNVKPLEEQNKPVVARRNYRTSKPTQTKRKPQRMRSRSLTSIKREIGADGITRLSLDYTNPNKWKSLKSRMATKLQAMLRGFLWRRRWILRKLELHSQRIRRQKLTELQLVETKKYEAMRNVRYELEDAERTRRKQVKALVKERVSLEMEVEGAQKARENWRHEIRKEKEQAKRWAETKKVDNVVTMLNSSAVTGFEVEQAGTKKRIKALKKEVNANESELERTNRSLEDEKEWKQQLDECIRDIVSLLREGLGPHHELVDYIAKYSGVLV